MTKFFLNTRHQHLFIVLVTLFLVFSPHPLYAADSHISAIESTDISSVDNEEEKEKNVEITSGNRQEERSEDNDHVQDDTTSPYKELQETYLQAQKFFFNKASQSNDYQTITLDDHYFDIIPYYDDWQDIIVDSSLNQTDIQGKGYINPYVKQIVLPDTVDLTNFGHLDLTINFKDYQTDELIQSYEHSFTLSDVASMPILFHKQNSYYTCNLTDTWNRIILYYSHVLTYDDIIGMVKSAPIYHQVYSGNNVRFEEFNYYVRDRKGLMTPSTLFEGIFSKETMAAKAEGRLALAGVGHCWSSDDPDNMVYAYDFNDIDVVGSHIYLYDDSDEEDPVYYLYKGDDLIHSSDVKELYQYYSFGSNTKRYDDYGFFTLWLEPNLLLKTSVDIYVDRTSSLTLTKRVENHEANDDEKYNFTIHFYKDGEPWRGHVDVSEVPDNVTVKSLITYNPEQMVSYRNSMTVSMPANTSVTLKNLPVGVTYEIEETSTGAFTTASENASSTIDLNGETAVFTNTYANPFDLSLSKQVSGNLGDRQRYFTFDIDLTHASPNTRYDIDLSQCDQETNVLTNPDAITTDDEGHCHFQVALKHQQSLKINHLNNDTHYTITEAASDYQSTYHTSDNKSGTQTCQGILNDDTTITYTNSRDGAVPTSQNITPVYGLLPLTCGGLIFSFRRRRRHG